MKILRIRFQNLNSLSGIWDIRFTDPAYTENNIFAITGPTGAGKSTILDSICLALYGSTPRLGKITKTSNEIMSRHTGICFAEIEFSTTKGTYRCHWSQHRSRNKTNGELQQPKHEIADALSDTILESRIRNVANKVEEVTGMDFDRFTRSTLLAQGGFAAFLEASANERAPILEQITGTEIYSQLSMKVHELQGDEQQKLNDLEQSLAHINLLPQEVEEELNTTIIETEKESVLCKKEIENLRMQQSWLETINRLTSEKNSFLQKLDLLNKETKSKRHELGRLQPALTAKAIEPLFQELNNLLESEKSAIKEQRVFEKEISSLTQKLETSNNVVEDAEKVLLQTKNSRETGLLLIRNVQTIDHTILDTKKRLQEQTEELSAKQTSQKKEATLIGSLKHDLLQKQQSQKLLKSFFNRHACDEQLPEALEAIRLQVSALNNLQKQLCTIAEAGEKVKQKRLKCQQTVTQFIQARRKLQKETASAGKKFDHFQKTINQILQGKTPANLQQTLFRTRIRQKGLEDIIKLLSKLDSKTKSITALHKEIAIITEQKPITKEKQTICDREKRNKQQKFELLEKNILLLNRIQTLEEDRAQLQNDTPCPLCGSTNHPYNHGNLPEISQEDFQLQSVKKEIVKITEESAQLAQNSAIENERFKSCSMQAEEIQRQLIQLEKETQLFLTELELPPLIKINPEQLEQECRQLKKDQQQLEHDCTHLEKQNKELDAAGANKEKLLLAAQQLERDILEATHQESAIGQEEKNFAQEARKISDELVRITNELLEKIKVYGINSISFDKLPFIVKELEQRAEKWRNNLERMAQITNQLIHLTEQLGNKEILHKTLTQQIQECEDMADIATYKVKELKKERVEFFGTKNPLKESQQLQQKVKDARKKYDKLLKELTEFEKEITTSRALLNRLLKEIDIRKVTISRQERLFNQAIADSIFLSTQEFFNSRISSEELDILQELNNKLQREKAELQALCKDKEISLQLEKAKQISKKSVKELRQQIGEVGKQLESHQKKAVTIREQLKTNTIYKSKSEEQLAAIASQKIVLGRWNRLHMLIGSADGKKFRNFAQGLTFELMVHHANVHLKNMNNRYILIRDQEHPLDLNVIDTYQADEIRSTKNLSGGESFLMSLALALGLSRMASQNVRVDSLFLDEGFGTLDENALESALETLAGLNDENKLIGIISHVAALKERIPLQIKIIPGNTGNSSISGPGVTMEPQ